MRDPQKKASFLFNNVLVRYVATCPETGISFYCSTRTNYGVRVNDTIGIKTLVNPSTTHTRNSKCGYDAKRKQFYLQFKNAFGHNKNIRVAHAVWLAAGRDIPEGMNIDHINGCLANNSLANLRCLDPETNNRDGGFLRKLRNKGFNPARIDRTSLLRYYSRMALLKPNITKYRYFQLSFEDLWTLLWGSPSYTSYYLQKKYNIQIVFAL